MPGKWQNRIRSSRNHISGNRRSRRAFVGTTDLTYGYARMFEMLREGSGEQGIRVFRNLDDALEWVLAKNTAT
jgi:hypothetical protein